MQFTGVPSVLMGSAGGPAINTGTTATTGTTEAVPQSVIMDAVIRGDTSIPEGIKKGSFSLDDLFLAFAAAIQAQESKLTAAINNLNGATRSADVRNKVSDAIQSQINKLDPTKPGATVDISKAQIQTSDKNGNPETLSLVDYLKQANIQIENPEKVNATQLQGAMTTLKSSSDTENSNQQIQMLQLQKEQNLYNQLISTSTQVLNKVNSASEGILRNI
jgi:hypothetical protein